MGIISSRCLGRCPTRLAPLGVYARCTGDPNLRRIRLSVGRNRHQRNHRSSVGSFFHLQSTHTSSVTVVPTINNPTYRISLRNFLAIYPPSLASPSVPWEPSVLGWRRSERWAIRTEANKNPPTEGCRWVLVGVASGGFARPLLEGFAGFVPVAFPPPPLSEDR